MSLAKDQPTITFCLSHSEPRLLYDRDITITLVQQDTDIPLNDTEMNVIDDHNQIAVTHLNVQQLTEFQTRDCFKIDQYHSNATTAITEELILGAI